MRLLLLREEARDIGAREAVFHVVVGRVDVIPLPVHLHSRPYMAASFDAARFHACRLEELNVGGVIALASDRHAQERPIDAQVPERVIIADVVDDPIMQRKRRLIVVHVSVGQALCNDFSGLFIRVDKTIASNFDLEGEPHIARRLRVAHHKLVLITPGTDELIAQHVGITESLGRRESGVVYPDIGIVLVDKALLVLVAAGTLRAAIGSNRELRRHSRLRLLVGHRRAPSVRIDAVGAGRHRYDVITSQRSSLDNRALLLSAISTCPYRLHHLRGRLLAKRGSR